MPSEEPIGDKPTPNVSSRDERPSRVDRLRLPYLLGRYPSRLVWAAFLLVNGFLTIGLLASVAMISGTPLVFPSLGPTALLLFHNPMQPAASPRNMMDAALHWIDFLKWWESEDRRLADSIKLQNGKLRIVHPLPEQPWTNSVPRYCECTRRE